ncbi:MAG: hypothetical protein JSV24_11415 [Bacteroidales bacterium]|nr:MAG: hypothetical protein JSV24_11415 [Bacteroidales bacterium]
MNLRKVYIITSIPGKGKTTFLSELATLLKRGNIAVGGLLERGEWKNGERSGFNLEDLSTGKTMPLATVMKKKSWKKLGKFYFNPDSVSYGNILLQGNEILKNEVIILDEIGPLEINGELWARGLTRITEKFRGILILSVRQNLVKKVTEYWHLPEPETIDITEEDPCQARDSIQQYLEQR